MELMSPAGNSESFYAAVNGGAEAVYLGLNLFNARKPARNFSFEEISGIISFAHAKNVKVYITLNTDLKSSELENASKILSFLNEIKADAIIVKDIALIYLIDKYFSPFEFHLSTQFGISNTAGMFMAEKLGASRVVLARELNLDEIKALSEPFYPKTEVFVQGSMCFSFSGKCLMSSWFGGKSANRGSCQAPCRFRFEKELSGDFKPYFSMKDLNLSNDLTDLEKAGVAALKIEGRLKSAEWVGEITKYYRNLLDNKVSDGSDPSRFSGREQGSGFYGGLENLITSKNSGTVKMEISSKPQDRRERHNGYDLRITADSEIYINILTDLGDAEYRTKVKKLVNEKRGINLSEIETRLRDVSFGNLYLNRISLNNDILITKSQLNNIVSDLGAIIAPLSRKEIKFLKNIKLPFKLEYELANPECNPKNSIEVCFGNANILKIFADDIDKISNEIKDSGIKKVIVSHAHFSDIAKIKELSNRVRVEISLFPILFENDLEDCRKIITELEHTNNISYEANDIGHLRLLKNTSKKIDCGPGLSPYNFIAVKQLEKLGLDSTHIPLEADIETIDGLKNSSLPLRMTIFSKIPLFYTRAASENFNEGTSFTERENYRFSVHKFNDISIFSSDDYFTIQDIDLSFLKVHEIIIDLSGETDILNKFQALKRDPSKFPGLNFNLKRRLF
ncbi:MAG TPA: peptidase U32 family protein [Clostridiales bacterium]|nr:peptidase U32 family protein [Clostridiales bacterium]HQP69518.1 peptidase U32 family protein [Clostridiales bacterium]